MERQHDVAAKCSRAVGQRTRKRERPSFSWLAPPVVNLMDALKKSLDAVRPARRNPPRPWVGKPAATRARRVR